MALQSRPAADSDREKDREKERQENERNRERDQKEREREREKSKPSGQQDATLPGSTPETSDQMPKPGEAGTKGKGPLKFDPNAPAVDTVAQKKGLRVEGKLDQGKRWPEQQIHSSQIPPERDPEQAWEEHARYAINGLYPRLREGEDWAIGREDIDSELKLLHGEEQVDWGKVQEAAKKLAGNDPYTAYKPKPGLGTTPRDEGFDLGERHRDHPNYELPREVAQSEVNPKSNEKVPSQAYQPPIREDDPNFNEDGSRKAPPPEGYDQ